MPSVSKLCSRKTHAGVSEDFGSCQAAGLGWHTPLAHIHVLLNIQRRPQLAGAQTLHSVVTDVAACESRGFVTCSSSLAALVLVSLSSPTPPIRCRVVARATCRQWQRPQTSPARNVVHAPNNKGGSRT